ncbi:MAG: thioesterase family protein [Tidjanibacter sp.]|nr:thioesterase family protein [Tidjanibacter sp.]
MKSIEVGTTHVSTTLVDNLNVARVVGSGDLDVFATPAMIALMENAAMNAVKPFLDEGETTVGGEMNCTHTAPSPIGATIEAEAVVEAVEGRKITYTVEARCGDTIIGRGRHVRFVVNAAKFMAKLL